MAARTLSIEDIHRLATGAWILGAGGGGDPYHSYLNMRELYRVGIEVELIEPMTLADDARIAVVSAMGAPLVGEERLDDPIIAARAVQTMEDYLGQKFDAVMAVEIGGSNGLQPFLVAAIMDIPVVVITEPGVIARILAHTGLDGCVQPRAQPSALAN